MLLNIDPHTAATIGSISISALSHVIALDTSPTTDSPLPHALDNGTTNVAFSPTSLQSIEEKLAIVVPCMNEEASILSGVLHGIPHHCLIILVSNGSAENFTVQSKLLTAFCRDAGREGLAVHQRDPILARAFVEAGLPHIVNFEDGAARIRNGKGEAMMLGTALAYLAHREYVGFVDADNLLPGAVNEYCKVFAAGLLSAINSASSSPTADDQTNSNDPPTPLAMIRIKWASKPKIADGQLILRSEGRCSRVVNRWMNTLLNSLIGDVPHDIIHTANAGEHAMSTALALRLNFATGYAVEPFQLIDAWQRSGILPLTPAVTPQGSPPHHSQQDPKNHEPPPPALTLTTEPLGNVTIIQIQTLNPHIHDFSKGEAHIQHMQAAGLSTIANSRLSSCALKQELGVYMREELGDAGDVPETSVYPAMEGMNWAVFQRVAEREGGMVFG